MLREVRAAISRANKDRRDEEYTLTTWLLDAIRAKLCHLERSKRATRKRVTKRLEALRQSRIDTT